MKKIIKLLLVLSFVFCLYDICFAEIEKIGEYYRFKSGDDYMYGGFVEEGNKKYYVGDNGYVAVNTWIVVSEDEKYYASRDGSLCTNTVETIDGKGYYFDYDSRVRYGWIDGLYYANDEGYLVTGFQRLTVYSDDWISEAKIVDVDNRNQQRWFYFNTSGSKKYQKCYSDDEDYTTVMIDNKKYCFDTNGVLCTGWRKIKYTDPPIAGYMYFSEQESETQKLSYGEAAAGTWLAAEGPSDEYLTGDADVRYYYFKHNGEPVCAKSGEYVKYRIDNKTFCFNSRGVAVYGVKKINNDYYYFGDDVQKCSMQTGKLTIDTGDGYKLEYYFDDDGKGYTGVYKDKLYYKGLLQKAESGVVAIKINGVTRLVNTKGQIQKNKKNYKDSDGVKWSTNSSGVVTYTEDGEACEPEEPEITGD